MNKQKNIKINAVLNIIKQCCNVLFPLITYPYVARVLGEVGLGKYSFADNIIGVCIITATLGIPSYAVREGSRIRNDKAEITKLSSELLSISIISMIASFLLLGVAIVLFPRLQKDVILLAILSFNILANVFGREWVNTIYEDFLYITVRYIAFQTLALILIFIFIKSQDDYIKYTVIMLIANAGGAVVNIFYSKRYVPLRVTLNIDWKRHLKPIMYLFCVSIALTIYVRSDIAILGFVRSDGEVGVYTLSSKIYLIIKNLLNAIIMVATPRAAYYLGKNDVLQYTQLLNKLQKALYVFIMPCVAGAFCISKEIMLLVGGSRFEYGYISLRILCFALFFAVLAAFYSSGVLLPNRDDKDFFIATAVAAVVNVVLNLVAIPKYGIEGAAATTLLSEMCVLYICRHHAKQYYKIGDIKTVILSVMIGCISIILVCTAVKMFVASTITRTILSILLSAISYTAILLICRNSIAQELINTIRIRSNGGRV